MTRITFILLLICSGLYGSDRQKGTYTVYVNLPGESIRAEVLYENRKLSVDYALTYTWYAANKIMETRGGYSGRLLSGQYSSFYLNENLKEQGAFENGLKNGEWKSWYENGKLREISHWSKGRRSGWFKKFTSRGELMSEGSFKRGVLHGTEKQYEGTKLVSSKRYKNGQEILPKVKPAKDTAQHNNGIQLNRIFRKKAEPKPGHQETVKKGKPRKGLFRNKNQNTESKQKKANKQDQSSIKGKSKHRKLFNRNKNEKTPAK